MSLLLSELPAIRRFTILWAAASLMVLKADREMGGLLGKGGLDGNVLRIKPPLCLTAEDVDFALEVLDRVFTRVST
jgi:4-aminobutyrate aminotransferase-like enzyme